MAYEQRPGDIAIFLEKSKTNDKAPDWKGTLLTPDGQKLQVALWRKSDTMLAGKVEEPRQRNDDANPRREPERSYASRETAVAADLNDEIPF